MPEFANAADKGLKSLHFLYLIQTVRQEIQWQNCMRNVNEATKTVPNYYLSLLLRFPSFYICSCCSYPFLFYLAKGMNARFPIILLFFESTGLMLVKEIYM